ncbi:MAG: FeoA family protein [Myxococcota bacterium]|jgi:Fe2+ transport system protein FeoA
MTLIDAKPGADIRVDGFDGGMEFAERMHGYGLWEGKLFKVIKAAPFNGPILIEDTKSGARIMIGRGIAARVEVSGVEKQ